MRRWIGVLCAVLLAITALTAVDCSSSDEEKPATSGAASLEADDFYFQPTELSGQVGKTLNVEIKNEGKATHTFTIDALGIDQTLKPGETNTIAVTPNTGGDLPFYCRFHRDSNGMKGAIAVSGSASASSSATPAPSTTRGQGSGY